MDGIELASSQHWLSFCWNRIIARFVVFVTLFQKNSLLSGINLGIFTLNWAFFIETDFALNVVIYRSRSTGSSFGKDNSEYSPIFIQFLDCVYQIWRQMPWEFEFNDKLLLLLAYAYNSRFTSDFLFDNLLERKREYRLRDLRWKEQTRACDGCWSVRTASKAQSVRIYTRYY